MCAVNVAFEMLQNYGWAISVPRKLTILWTFHATDNDIIHIDNSQVVAIMHWLGKINDLSIYTLSMILLEVHSSLLKRHKHSLDNLAFLKHLLAVKIGVLTFRTHVK